MDYKKLLQEVDSMYSDLVSSGSDDEKFSDEEKYPYFYKNSPSLFNILKTDQSRYEIIRPTIQIYSLENSGKLTTEETNKYISNLVYIYYAPDRSKAERDLGITVHDILNHIKLLANE